MPWDWVTDKQKYLFLELRPSGYISCDAFDLADFKKLKSLKGNFVRFEKCIIWDRSEKVVWNKRGKELIEQLEHQRLDVSRPFDCSMQFFATKYDVPFRVVMQVYGRKTIDKKLKKL
jgi:hypothetical protein